MMENRKKKKQLSITPGYTERRKNSLQVGSSNFNQHAYLTNFISQNVNTSVLWSPYWMPFRDVTHITLA